MPIISALLGAPREDWRLFSDWADDFFKLFTWNVVEYENDILTAWGQLDDYIDDMVATRRESLTDDLISELIRAEDDGDRLTISELRMLAAGILMAGTDTTRNQVAAAVDVFCDYPEQWELLAQRPELAMKAVEEVMRFSPVIFGAMRMTTEDVEIADVMIPAGTFVMCNTAAANHDPDVYVEPERFDITREDAPPMQTFGAGAHYCLGANLARREIADALRVMSSRLRNLRREGSRNGSRWSESAVRQRFRWHSTLHKTPPPFAQTNDWAGKCEKIAPFRRSRRVSDRPWTMRTWLKSFSAGKHWATDCPVTNCAVGIARCSEVFTSRKHRRRRYTTGR